MTKLLSLTNICISVWQKYLSSVQMHLLKDTFCSGSMIHNFTVQHSLKYEWNFGKNICTIIPATQEKIYNYTSVSWHWWWDTVCAHKHHIQSFLSAIAAYASKHDRFSSSRQPHSWKIHVWAHQFRMSVLAGGWMFKYHIEQEILYLLILITDGPFKDCLYWHPE